MTTIDVLDNASDDTPAHHRGNGRPIDSERTITDLVVTGTIPAELDGRYLRNGANPLTGTSEHPFFGDGMVHGVRLRDGQAEWYRNRYVQTPFIADPSVDPIAPDRHGRAAEQMHASLCDRASVFEAIETVEQGLVGRREVGVTHGGYSEVTVVRELSKPI